jgi:hypothetical protein
MHQSRAKVAAAFVKICVLKGMRNYSGYANPAIPNLAASQRAVAKSMSLP